MNRETVLATIGLTVAAGLLIAAGTGFMQGQTNARQTSPDPQQAIDFTLKDLEGQEVEFAKATKGKAVVLKFGALWCGWCNKQSEDFQTLQTTLDADREMIVEVSIKEDYSVDDVRKHKEELGLKHMILRDSGGGVAGDYKVEGIPAVFVIDPDGMVLYRGHYTPADKLRSLLDEAVTGRAETAPFEN